MQLPARIGKYELLEYLGGGLSHVYRARDTVIDRTVAVKILAEAGSADPEVKARFLAEARVLGNLHHDNILAIYDYGEDDQHRPYIVMEFLQGENLRKAIAGNRTGALNNKLRIALQVARALAYVHDNKLVHRDVKPENVNIAPDGAVKLMDFGIAKGAGLSLTRAGYVLGTPYYMAPEQVLGNETSGLADVYAFGILLFELIAGVKPHQGDTVERIFYSILNEPLDPEPLRRAGAPEPLCALVLRCAAKDPQQRIQGFSLIVAELSKPLDTEFATPFGRPAASSMAAPPASSIESVPSSSGLPIWFFAALVAISLAAGLLVWLGPPRWSWVLATAAVLLAATLAVWGLLLRRDRVRDSSHGKRHRDVAENAQKAPAPQSAPPSQPAPPEELLSPPAAARPPGQSQAIVRPIKTKLAADSAPGPPLPAPPQEMAGLPASDPSPETAPPGTFKGLFGTPAPTKAPSVPPDSSPSPTALEGEFTRIFRTSPDPAPPKPVPALSGAPPVPEPLADHGGDVTQVFQVERVEVDTQLSGNPASDAAIIPNVALTITACSDVAFAGLRFQVHRFPFRIGRPSGDLVLPFDAAISREHAEIQFADGGFAIEDLGSANGTFVNGQRLQPHQPEPLLFGARILLGSNTQLTFIANNLEELPDLTGELIGGRYRLIARLFASTKSAVYRATDARLPDGLVLVKILSPRLARQPGYRGQFEHEATIASRLRHPYIGRILDYGETTLGLGDTFKTLYISIEFLEGGSLAQRLATDQRFELDRIAGWLEKLASSLDYMHEEGVIHGGIKPSSIVFDSRDNPHLTDFAIAIAAGARSHRTVIGSPAFLAPEQWEGKDLSPATDQYSLAVLLYLVMTGSPPYEGQEHPEVRKRNLLRGPVVAHEMAQQNRYPPVPVTASAVLQRALQTDPSARFPTAAEFAKEFRNALAQPGPTSPRKPYVFISYHRATGSPWALLFKNELEREYGYDVFIDTEQRDRAGQFPAKLQRHIERSDVFVCLLGKGTLESTWVNREIELAHQGHKPMVPIFQEGFRFPGDISAVAPHVRELLLFDGVKLLDRQNLYVSSAIKSLSEVIRQSLPNH